MSWWGITNWNEEGECSEAQGSEESNNGYDIGALTWGLTQVVSSTIKDAASTISADFQEFKTALIEDSAELIGNSEEDGAVSWISDIVPSVFQEKPSDITSDEPVDETEEEKKKRLRKKKQEEEARKKLEVNAVSNMKESDDVVVNNTTNNIEPSLPIEHSVYENVVSDDCTHVVSEEYNTESENLHRNGVAVSPTLNSATDDDILDENIDSDEKSISAKGLEHVFKTEVVSTEEGWDIWDE